MPDIGIDLGTTTTLLAHVVDTTQSEIIQTAIKKGLGTLLDQASTRCLCNIVILTAQPIR